MASNPRTSELSHTKHQTNTKTPCLVLALFVHPGRVSCGLLSVLPRLVQPGNKRVDVLELDDARANISATRDDDSSPADPMLFRVVLDRESVVIPIKNHPVIKVFGAAVKEGHLGVKTNLALAS